MKGEPALKKRTHLLVRSLRDIIYRLFFQKRIDR